MKAKKELLDTLHQDVAAKEDGGLKRMLGEDESVSFEVVRTHIAEARCLNVSCRICRCL